MATGEAGRPHRRTSVSVLVLLLLFLVLAPILVLQTRVYHRGYEAKRKGEAQANLEVARAVAASFEVFLASLRTEAKAAGQGLVLLAPFRQEQAMWYMAQLKRARPEVTSVSWLEPNGLVFASSDSALVGTVWPDRSWRRELLHGGDYVVTDVTRTRDPRKGRFCVLQSVRDRTKSLRGVVVLVLDPDQLGEAIRIRRSGRGGVSLVDSSGWLVFHLPTLAHSVERDWGSRLSIVRRALAGGEATERVTAPFGEEPWIGAEAPVPSVGWAAGADRPEQEALAPIRADTANSSLVFALVTACGVMLAMAAARTISGPLRQLRDSARVIGSESGSTRVPVSGPAEVADLAYTLNRMAEEIRQRQHEQERLLVEVQRQRALLETVLQHVNYGVVAIDAASQRILLRNDSFERITGQPVAPGSDCVHALRAWRHANGVAYRPEEWPPLRALAEGEVIADEEVEYLRPDGTRPTLLANAAPVRDAQGHITAAVVTLHDITERKQAQQERERLHAQVAQQARLLDTIVTATDSRLAYLDRDLHYVRVNAAYAANARMAPEEFVGRHRLEVFPNAPEVAAMYQRALDSGEPDSIAEYTGVPKYRPEVGPRTVRIDAAPVKNARGEVEGLVTSMVDITDQVRLRQQLVGAERARAQLAETLGREIAHRTKNNLAIVAGLLQLQLDRDDAPDLHADLIRDAVTRIMSFAALHEQMYQRHSETVELLDALRRVAEVDRQALSAGEVTISVVGEPADYPSGVATNLCVVANELMTNAIKHGGSQQADSHVEVRVGRQGGRLVLSVWNSHNPVAADFDVRGGSRTGLGLVRTIVEDQYGGSFTLVPDRGGTLAHIVLDDERLLTR